VLSNLTLVLAIGIPFMLVMVVFTVAVLWLTSRGQMMFIRAVALDDEQLGPNWRETRVPAWSLFRFRLVLAAIGYVLGLFVMVFGYLTARGILLSEEPEIWILLGALVPYIILLVVFGVCFGLISLFLRGFVSPLMFHLNCPCVEAWRVFLNLLSGNVLSLLGYVGIKIAYQIAFGLVAMLVGCVTCCIGMLPVIHHALFAPFYVFDRAFPMYMLGSLGPDFTLIRERVQNGGPDSLPPLP